MPLGAIPARSTLLDSLKGTVRGRSKVRGREVDCLHYQHRLSLKKLCRRLLFPTPLFASSSCLFKQNRKSTPSASYASCFVKGDCTRKDAVPPSAAALVGSKVLDKKEAASANFQAQCLLAFAMKCLYFGSLCTCHLM